MIASNWPACLSQTCSRYAPARESCCCFCSCCIGATVGAAALAPQLVLPVLAAAAARVPDARPFLVAAVPFVPVSASVFVGPVRAQEEQ